MNTPYPFWKLIPSKFHPDFHFSDDDIPIYPRYSDGVIEVQPWAFDRMYNLLHIHIYHGDHVFGVEVTGFDRGKFASPVYDRIYFPDEAQVLICDIRKSLGEDKILLLAERLKNDELQEIYIVVERLHDFLLNVRHGLFIFEERCAVTLTNRGLERRWPARQR